MADMKTKTARNISKQHKTAYLPLDSKPGNCIHCPLKVDISWETMFCAGLQKTIVDDEMIRRCPLREFPSPQTPPKNTAGTGYSDGYCDGWNDCLGIIAGKENTDGQTEDL